MPRIFLVFAIIFIAVLLQISFLPNVVIQGAYPDLVLVIIIFWATQLSFDKVWPWASLAGLMLDFAYFWPIGINIAALVFIAYGANYLARRFLVVQSPSKFFILAGILILGAIFNNFITSILLKISTHEAINFKIAFFNAQFGMKILYDLLLFAIIYVPLLKLEKNIAMDNSWPKPGR